MFRTLFFLTLVFGASAAFAQGKPPPPKPGQDKQPRADLVQKDLSGHLPATMRADIWVDNWYALWVNGEKLTEDSVSYQTERSFNAETVTFNAALPMTLAIELRDFMENETGLEYIGTGRQQMGDGGAIAQITDLSSGKVLAVTDDGWRCLVAQHAPVQTSCAAESDPEVGQDACAANTVDAGGDWTAPGFDDSAWPAATVHSAADVGPKDGYDKIDWNASARLIWGPSLKQDNILFCRLTLGG